MKSILPSKRLAAMAGDRKKITAADLKAVAKKRMLKKGKA
jgi:hypothetical protein